MSAIEDWDLPRRRQLVEALLACNCMQTPQSRDQIIGDLSPEIGHRIKRFPGSKQDVTSIVSACADFTGGIEALAEIVKDQEGPTNAWRQVQTILQGQAVGPAPITTMPPAAASKQPASPPIQASVPPNAISEPAANDAPAKRTHDTSAKTKLILFGVLLVAALSLTILFAGGWLRFGLGAQFTFAMYVLFGLLAAVTCYGLLSSSGELEGKEYGVAVKLSGAIVALAVVAGGGALYEKYVPHTAASFDQRVNFYSAQPTQLEKLNGEATLTVGNKRFTERLRETGTVLYQGIPSEWLGKPVQLDLDCPGYELAPVEKTALLNDRETIAVKVVRKRQFALPNEAKLEIGYREGVALNYVGRPDAKNVVLTLRAVSQADLAIPIDADATLEILSNSGAPMFNIPLKVTDTTIIPPRGMETIHLDGFMGKEQYQMALTGKNAVVKLRYDRQIEKSEMEFQTEFTFSKKTVPATR
jgi:Effector-associated domain 2